ncbi:hypothetical protein CQW23_02006 [Capsicum baccatum]|uniref:Uncharacterized protein n=1 Tax=Capsicum baccatum TaxID=33114 RepID=A0A2G2XQ66_CAPBA|nr:hypothetical protein CQW23_02006 [Capsicum baccatum]
MVLLLSSSFTHTYITINFYMEERARAPHLIVTKKFNSFEFLFYLFSRVIIKSATRSSLLGSQAIPSMHHIIKMGNDHFHDMYFYVLINAFVVNVPFDPIL